VEVVSDALPLTNATTPSEIVPSLNVTLPVGVPAAGATALTVTDNVTDWLIADGFGLDVSLVDEVPWLTVCVTTADALFWKFGLPP